MYVDVLVGLQWGDEGKGKVVHVLAQEYDIVARFQGGPNAGHTLLPDASDQPLILHHIPSGIVHPHTITFLGAGMVIDPIILREELRRLEERGIPWQNRIIIDARAHLILPTHRLLDRLSEQAKGTRRIGSTLRGIGPVHMDKTGRNGLPIGIARTRDFRNQYAYLRDKHLRLAEAIHPKALTQTRTNQLSIDPDEEQQWFTALQELLDSIQIVNGPYWLEKHLNTHKHRILVEGAQGTLLDNLFGTYPYVTSSRTLATAVCAELGISFRVIRHVYGVAKAYVTRVGEGPFPTECAHPEQEWLREKGGEYGSTTGRPRRCGWLDLVALRYAVMLNAVHGLFLTKIDVLSGRESLPIAIAYQHNTSGKQTREFPVNLQGWQPVYEECPGWDRLFLTPETLHPSVRQYIQRIEQATHIPVLALSIGPEKGAWVHLREITSLPA